MGTKTLENCKYQKNYSLQTLVMLQSTLYIRTSSSKMIVKREVFVVVLVSRFKILLQSSLYEHIRTPVCTTKSDTSYQKMSKNTILVFAEIKN